MNNNSRSNAAPKGGSKKSNGKKKAKGGVNLRQATSSLKVYNSKNVDGPVRSVPAAMGSMKVSGRPKIQSVGALGDSRIIHREYLGDVSMAASFTSTKYAINAGLGRTFPWLSTVAQRFESYRFNKLRFCFETSCSSTQTGTVLLIPDYDAQDSAPVNKVQALSYRNSARAQAWLSFCQESSQEDLNKQKSYFVRQGSNPSGTDIRLYDVGNLFLCVQGADTNTVGELWVEYDVHLMTPQNSDEFVSALITGVTSISKTVPFGTAPTEVGSLDVTIGTTTLTFNQAYEGLIFATVTGTGLTALAATISTGSSVTNQSVFVPLGAGTVGYAGFIVRVNPGAVLTFDAATGNTTVTGFNLRIGMYTYANG